MSPPKQARSERTAQRILDAAQRLIEREGLAALSIPEVVRLAASSTGSFYARFKDKNALLAALEERFFAQVESRVDALADPERWRDRPTAELMLALTREMLEQLRRHARLVCAFMCRSTHEATFASHARRFHDQLTRRMRALLLSRRAEMRHPDPEVAVDLALELALTFIQGRILFAAAHAAPHGLSDERLAEELTRMFLSFAGIAP